ncbi:trimeric intracellular cation channel type A isoform X3 [Apteryx mantelli]|uniref:Trimeric intracellular cation channel type A n=1 Tax=Apteryx mantelli TaxID=2696672 RepID=A0ABM4FVF5_9AVES
MITYHFLTISGTCSGFTEYMFVFCFTTTFLWLFCWRKCKESLLEGIGASVYLWNVSSHLEFASQELWRCLVEALLPLGFVLCSTALEVTYLLICYLENHLFITSVITPVLSWPQQSGSGVALMSNFEQLLRGVWKPETNEILHMSFPTKASLYGTLLFTLQQTRWLPISEANLIFFFTMFMIVCKVFMTATHSHASPFAPVEDFICPVFFGSVSSGHTSHHHDQHGASHDVSHPPPPPPPPAKSKEELNEGTRKRKAKKAE